MESINKRDENNEIDIKILMHLLKKFKIIFFSIVFFSVLISYFYAKVQPNIYKSTVLVVDSESKRPIQQGLGLSSGVSQAIGLISNVTTVSNSQIHQAFDIIKTRKFLLEYASSKNLKKIIFQNLWDGKKQQWIGKEPSNEDLYNNLQENINISPPPPSSNSTVYRISFTMKGVNDYSEIANITNNLVVDVNEIIRKQNILDSRKSIEFLAEEYEKTSILSIKLLLNKIMQSNIGRITMANVTKDVAIKIIDPAVVPIKPEPKNTILILMIGAISGIAIAFLTIIIINIRKYE